MKLFQSASQHTRVIIVLILLGMTLFYIDTLNKGIKNSGEFHKSDLNVIKDGNSSPGELEKNQDNMTIINQEGAMDFIVIEGAQDDVVVLPSGYVVESIKAIELIRDRLVYSGFIAFQYTDILAEDRNQKKADDGIALSYAQGAQAVFIVKPDESLKEIEGVLKRDGFVTRE